MKKLEHDIGIKIPKEVRELAQKEDADIPDIDELTIEIYFNEEDSDDEWEVYVLNMPEMNDWFEISIAKFAMDISRQIAEDDGGTIEEFIWRIAIQTVMEKMKEDEAKDFFEEISD